MSRRIAIVFGAACLGAVALFPALTSAAVKLNTTAISSSLPLPVFVCSPPGDTARLFIVQQRGDIKILNIPGNTMNATPFLNIDSIVFTPTSSNDERGLLGMSFDPNYSTNGYFYLNYSDNSGDTRIVRYTVSDKVPGHPTPDPNVADPASAQLILFYDQPFSNHNGGWLGFGPNDGYLYIALGDGGSGCDPGNRAQDFTDQLLGKMLRVDVHGGDDFPADANKNYHIPPTNPFVGITGDDEIWAYGLRNPFRNSFDRATGDLWIADVGQIAMEEINFQAASVTTVKNYGWACNEGTLCSDLATNSGGSGCTSVRPNCFCNDPNFTYPIRTYTRAGGACTVIGGYVYRGAAHPMLQGTYFYTDFCLGRINTFKYDGTTITDSNSHSEVGTLSLPVSYGEDAAGELYIVLHGTGSNGSVRKISRPCAINFTTHPVSQTVCRNTNVTFTVAVTGQVNPITYTWKRNGVSVGAPSSPTLNLVNVNAVTHAGTYTCDVQDACDNLLPSNPAVLTVIIPAVGDVNGDCMTNVADVPFFIDVILGLDTTTGRVNRSNMNGMGGVDGNDIPGFVALILN